MIEETLKGAVIKTEDLSERFDEIALYFDYIEDESVTSEASITDNYVESNYTVQDHIALKPKIYRLRGCVGEVVYQNEYKWFKAIQEKVYNNPTIQNTMGKLKPIKALNIITEFLDADDLAQKIEAQKEKHFPESQILDYFIQICLALQFLHNKKIFNYGLSIKNICYFLKLFCFCNSSLI